MTSTAEILLAEQLRQAGIPHIREYWIDPERKRKHRADFLVTAGYNTLLVEVEGGGWINGRHSRGSGMERDCEKSALAAIAGYRVMRVVPAQVEDGRALAWIRAALGIEVAA